jgi:hypothetical protein
MVGFLAPVERGAEAATLVAGSQPTLATRGFGVPAKKDDIATQLREAFALGVLHRAAALDS